jgi:hypothetical protein
VLARFIRGTFQKSSTDARFLDKHANISSVLLWGNVRAARLVLRARLERRLVRAIFRQR